jgi:hypothetical protein
LQLLAESYWKCNCRRKFPTFCVVRKTLAEGDHAGGGGVTIGTSPYYYYVLLQTKRTTCREVNLPCFPSKLSQWIIEVRGLGAPDTFWVVVVVLFVASATYSCWCQRRERER